MTKADLQTGGGYTYQWRCAILLALNYFFDPVSYNDALHELVSKFGRVEAVHLEGEVRQSTTNLKEGDQRGTELELEDINLEFSRPGEPGTRQILIQVKTKGTGNWTPGEDALHKALYRFYRNASLDQGETETRFIFLSNRQFDKELDKLTEAIAQGTVTACTVTEKLYKGVCSYAKQYDKDPRDPNGMALDKDRFVRMLSQTALVDFLNLDAVRGNVQAKLQGYGRPDWEKAYDRLFSRFAELSTQVGGGRVTRELITEILGPGGKVALAPERRDFYRQTPLPDHYVPRPEVLAEVRARLLENAGDLTLSSAIPAPMPTMALHGMGGSGKSVIARALCDDPAVQAAFPDGVLWTSLGQTPDLVVRLREWIDVLGGTISETAPTVPRLTAILADRLATSACLLVVDDAWMRTHVESFRVGGPRCRLLITTRDAAIFENWGATLFSVPLMGRAEAVALLEVWADDGLRNTPGDLKSKILDRLSGLPLAIKLAGAQLKDEPPDEWLQSFDATDLEAGRVETDLDSLARTFAKSLNALGAADRRLFVALAIFRKGEPAPAVAIIRLWSALDGRTKKQGLRLLRDLADRALLEFHRSTNGAELDATASIHDLLRDFMAVELSEDGRLAAHRALLTSYRQTQVTPGAWHTAPNDGYLFDHLTYHLDQLADHDPAADDELRGLFAGQNWLHARIPASCSLYDGYLADLALAWSRADAETRRQIAAGGEPDAFAACVRCALIRTSVNSLAAGYVPALVARAVEVGFWRPKRALSLLLRVPDPKYRVAVATALLKISAQALPAAEREQVAQAGLAAATAIGNAGDRTEALAALAPQLTGELLEAALAAATAIGDARSRVQALSALAPHVTGLAREQALRDALAAVQAIPAEWDRAAALEAVAPQLTGEALEAGLAAALALRAERDRSLALVALAPQLTGEALERGLAATRDIGNERDRSLALAALVPQLTGEAREQVLREALTAALVLNPMGYSKAMVALAPQLTGDLLRKALAAVPSSGLKWWRALAWAALAPQLTGEAREQTLREAWAEALAFDFEDDREGALAALAPQLTGKLLAEALAAALAIEDWLDRVNALAALASQLTGELLSEGLVAGLAVGDERLRANALAAIAPRLTDDLLTEALAAALTIRDERLRANALAALAAQLTVQPLAQALATTQKISDEQSRERALVALAPHLTGQARERVLRHTLAAAANDFTLDCARVLVALAPLLTGELAQEGLALAQTLILDPVRYAEALASLAPQLTDDARQEALKAGLVVALGTKNEWERAAALAALAPQLTGELLRDARAAGAGLAPQLTGEAQEQTLKEALAAALAIPDDWDRVRALVALAPRLTGEPLEVALTAALATRIEWQRVDALADLAPHLTGEAREQALEAGLAAALAIDYEQLRAEALAALAPHLAGEALARGVAAALAIEDEGFRARALAAFVAAAPDPADLLRSARQAIADHLLRNLSTAKREDVLRFCADQALFAPPILDGITLAAIAGHIIEICQEWEWM